MPGPTAIADLLVQLRAARSPLARLRVATAAWRTLQALTPAERSQVASEIGMEGAAGLVERLAGRSDLDAGVVLDAIREAETRDPGRLRALLRPADASPASTPPRDLLSRGIAALESLVLTGSLPTPAATQPATAQDAPPPLGDTTAGAAEEVERSGPGEPRSDAPAEPAAEPVPPVPEAAPDAPEPPRPPEPDVPEPPVSPPGPPPPREQTGDRVTREAEGPAPVPPQRSATPPPVVEVDSRSSTPAPPPRLEPATPEAGPDRSAADRPAPVPAPDPAALAAALDAAPSLLARLSVARARATDLARLSADELAALLDRFDATWARRRVVTAVLEEGRPRTARALEMVDLLGLARDRQWCLSAMLHRPDLTAEDRAVLEDRLAAERPR